MSITYPLAFPSVAVVVRPTIRASSVVGIGQSIFTGSQQVYAHQGQWWEMEVGLSPMHRADAEEVVAWFLALNGREGTFTMGDPAGASLRGVGGGTPQVDGASQTGQTLNVKGLPLSTANIWKRGDWIQLGSGSTARLHKVLSPVTSDGAGEAAVDIWPRLRYSPSDSAAITVSNTVGLWRMASNQQDYTIDGLLYGYTFACVEALSV